MIAWGAEINAVDDRGYTALHLVIKNAITDPLASIDIVKQLTETGANTQIQDQSELMPIDYVGLLSDENLKEDLFNLLGSKKRRLTFLKNQNVRYMIATSWLLIMSTIFFFAFPKLHDTNLNVALALSGISCIASYTYTFLRSRAIP